MIMIRNFSRTSTVAVLLTTLVLPMGTAAAQSATSGTSTVVTGGNPEPQIILTILLSTIPAA
jgi:hypothetical protein